MPIKQKLTLGLGLLIATTPALANNKTYKIKEGDTIEVIAKKMHVPLSKMLQANGIHTNSILSIGASLKVPGADSGDSKRVAKVPAKPVAVAKVAKKTPSKTTILVTSKPVAHPKTVAAKGAKKPVTYPYTVRVGDNDWNIARLFGTSPDVVKKYNRDINWSSLQVGWVLQIPATVAPNAQKPHNISAYLAALSKPKNDSGQESTTETFAMKVKPSGDENTPAPPKVEAKPAIPAEKEVKPAKEDVQIDDDETPLIKDILAVDTQRPKSVARVIKKAMSMKGVRYRYGAMSRSSTDCSGFTSQVYASLGIHLPRTSGAQAGCGTYVPRSSLRPGDLIFFHTTRGNRISHVAIYVGNNKFIHASSGGGHVMESSLGEDYYNSRYVTARRIIKSRKELQTLLQDSTPVE